MRHEQRTIAVARQLRLENVPAEKLMWRVLRNRALGGFKFRRQHPIGPYFADFSCVECKIVVELDGETHLGREAPDRDRTKWMEAEGWQVLRFWNNEVYDELESVKEAIYQACMKRLADCEAPSPPTPLPRR
jgi:very-short-patch-repair endonuclease